VSRPRSRSRSAALAFGALGLAGLAALACPASARAQACCAGSTALSPGRLNLHEAELVGVQVRGTAITGSFDQVGRFSGPAGSAEVDLEEDLVGTVRVLSRGQFTVVVPIDETYRRIQGTPSTGGGFGDLQINARWDATLAGDSRILPGIALLGALTLPTGVPTESATNTWATDATGAGMVQGALGLSLEQTFGGMLVNLTGSATLHMARMADGTRTQLGPSFNAFAAIGYSFDAGPVAAITVSYTGSLGSVSGYAGMPESTVPGSARAQLRFGLSGGYELSDQWRIQGGVFGDPPASHFGQGQPAGAGLSATLLRSW
jgi:hypothetical protein